MGLLGPSCLTSGGPRLLYLGFEASLQAAFALESPELILLPTKYLQRCGSAALLAVSPAPNALCAYFRVGSHPQEEGKKKQPNKRKQTQKPNFLFFFQFIYVLLRLPQQTHSTNSLLVSSGTICRETRPPLLFCVPTENIFSRNFHYCCLYVYF